MIVPFLSLEEVTALHGAEINEAVTRTVNSGWYLQGKENKTFEKHFAEYVGAKYCVGCANGLDALTLIFRAYKEMGVMKEGDEVIVPANTFIATVLAITDNGLVPVLCEPKEETLEIDDEQIEGLITPKTKAIALVHLYGRNAYTDRIGELCRKYNLKLVQDCAQSHGLKVNASCAHQVSPHRGDLEGSLVGSFAYSFYPGKNLGALGDGGAVTTDDEELATIIRALANYGSQTKYIFDYEGRNSRLDEIQAAVLDVKLRYLDEDNAHRQMIARYYYDNISNPLVTLPQRLDDTQNVYHIFPVLVAPDHRAALQEHLANNGIGTIIHYPVAPHQQQCYANAPWNKYNTPTADARQLPITESLASRELSLPIGPTITLAQAHHVVEQINKYMR
ncbi:MAG: DegT/DnrJ/EryC1/StrS family aminotransferase [Prevotella sp.]|nr:DegT/DnrJ/EryC1/StrS family aminotransferase [Candidatus Prevotella equi]